jgi:hypothetical protein
VKRITDSGEVAELNKYLMEGLQMFVKANKQSLERMVYEALRNGADERNVKRILKSWRRSQNENVLQIEKNPKPKK